MSRERMKKLPSLLLPWYKAHHRDLPWRKDKEPYHVWISEIMLQQTRVEAVKGYYSRFLEKLPTVEALANADDELLTKLWEGLGYYSRVRNLKKAAQEIMTRHGGVFPGEHRDVLALSGIGPYTAGAICSICYDQPTPAVDGNVLRLVSRLTDDHRFIDEPALRSDFTRLLEEIYPGEAGDFTQALMELGATLCGPNTAPRCEECPCRELCLGYQRGTAPSLPVKRPKKQRRTEEKTVLILRCENRYALCKRPEKGLLAGLWQFPDLEGKCTVEQAIGALEGMGIRTKEVCRTLERNHIFTHITWEMRGIFLEVSNTGGEGIEWMEEDTILEKIALPTAYRQFWEERNV